MFANLSPNVNFAGKLVFKQQDSSAGRMAADSLTSQENRDQMPKVVNGIKLLSDTLAPMPEGDVLEVTLTNGITNPRGRSGPCFDLHYSRDNIPVSLAAKEGEKHICIGLDQMTNTSCLTDVINHIKTVVSKAEPPEITLQKLLEKYSK